jgi:hypothetical protein
MQLCCIPLRDLRYLRENIHARVLNLSAQRNPNMSPADLADYADETPKTTNKKDLRENRPFTLIQ